MPEEFGGKREPGGQKLELLLAVGKAHKDTNVCWKSILPTPCSDTGTFEISGFFTEGPFLHSQHLLHCESLRQQRSGVLVQ